MKYLLLLLPIFAHAQDSDYVQFQFLQTSCVVVQDPDKTNLKKVLRVNKDGTKTEGCYIELGDTKVAVFRDGE